MSRWGILIAFLCFVIGSIYVLFSMFLKMDAKIEVFVFFLFLGASIGLITAGIEGITQKKLTVYRRYYRPSELTYTGRKAVVEGVLCLLAGIILFFVMVFRFI